MTFFDAIDRDGAREQWDELIYGDIDVGYPLLVSGEILERVRLYLEDKKFTKKYYAEHAKYVGYLVGRLSVSTYSRHPQTHALLTLISGTLTPLYALPIIAQNNEPNVSQALLTQLKELAQTQNKYFFVKRKCLTEAMAEAFRLAWYKQETCEVSLDVITLLTQYATFSPAQQKTFDKMILKDTGSLSAWYAKSREKALKNLGPKH